MAKWEMDRKSIFVGVGEGVMCLVSSEGQALGRDFSCLKVNLRILPTTSCYSCEWTHDLSVQKINGEGPR